jgi:hypothetical protein
MTWPAGASQLALTEAASSRAVRVAVFTDRLSLFLQQRAAAAIPGGAPLSTLKSEITLSCSTLAARHCSSFETGTATQRRAGGASLSFFRSD